MAEVLNSDRPDKLSVVVFSGDFDKVHYALVMASAAAATDTDVTLFFTMEAARALLGPDENGAPGWTKQPTTGPFETGQDMNQAFQDRSVAEFETLLQACTQLGVRFMVCEMGLKALDLDRSQLRSDIQFEIGGVVTFLNDASRNGAMLFI
ncbi:DsrE/DsrF/DrsH-like family protein [Magnetovibrio sp. PR-2]|uniref:DsrE/DsrF/DrsH-like family protein n=1 Tax=Magnetovibrio sp. PR-2 TaxID=3120356 RepID=UPI002FCE0418